MKLKRRRIKVKTDGRKGIQTHPTAHSLVHHIHPQRLQTSCPLWMHHLRCSLNLSEVQLGGKDSRNSSMTLMFLVNTDGLAVKWDMGRRTGLADIRVQVPERTLAMWVPQATVAGAVSYRLADRKAGFSDLGVSIILDPQFFLSWLKTVNIFFLWS